MTEYTVKEIGRHWIVYADRRSIAACPDEPTALKLIAEDSASNRRRFTAELGQSPGNGARKT